MPSKKTLIFVAGVVLVVVTYEWLGLIKLPVLTPKA